MKYAIIGSMVFAMSLALAGCASKMGCARGNCADGQGVYNYSNGDRYDGEFKGGQRDGQGTMKYSNKDRYQGGFRSGQKEGQGEYQWANGDVYKGEFKGGQMEGPGAYTFGNGGPVLNATFQGGGSSGQGTFQSRKCELKDRSILCEN